MSSTLPCGLHEGDEGREAASAGKLPPHPERIRRDRRPSVGHAKGAWATVRIPARTRDLGLVTQVGGGSDEATRPPLYAAWRNPWRRSGLHAASFATWRLDALVRGARAMVSHAHNEPFGLTPLEAMAIGVPALMVNEGGFADTMSPVNSGRLIQRGDLGAWKGAYLDAKDPELRKAWAEAGRTHVETHFSMKVQIEALEQLFTQ